MDWLKGASSSQTFARLFAGRARQAGKGRIRHSNSGSGPLSHPLTAGIDRADDRVVVDPLNP